MLSIWYDVCWHVLSGLVDIQVWIEKHLINQLRLETSYYFEDCVSVLRTNKKRSLMRVRNLRVTLLEKREVDDAGRAAESRSRILDV